MQVAFTQSTEGLNKTERETFPWVRTNSSCQLSGDIGLFLPPDLNWNMGSSCVLSLVMFKRELTPSDPLVLRTSDLYWNVCVCVCVCVCVYLHICSGEYLLMQYHILLIPSTMWRWIVITLGCFHILATVNNAAMNVSAQISLWDPAFNTFGYTHRSGAAESWDNPILNVLRNLHTVFWSSCTIFHIHQGTTGSRFRTFLPVLVILWFLTVAIQQKWSDMSLRRWFRFPRLVMNNGHFSVQFSRSVVSNSETPWITARQASLSITNSRSSLKLTSVELVMPSSHLILCRPLLLLPPIPPGIRVFFPMSQLFAWGGQSTRVSALASLLFKAL